MSTTGDIIRLQFKITKFIVHTGTVAINRH